MLHGPPCMPPGRYDAWCWHELRVPTIDLLTGGLFGPAQLLTADVQKALRLHVDPVSGAERVAGAAGGDLADDLLGMIGEVSGTPRPVVSVMCRFERQTPQAATFTKTWLRPGVGTG